MTLAELFFIAAYIAMAFGSAIVVVLGLGVFLQVEHKQGQWIVPSLTPLITLGICLSTLFSHRNLTFASLDIESIQSGSGGGGTWVLRIITFLILGLCSAKIIGYLLKRDRSAPSDGSVVMVTFALYYVASVLLPSAFGSHPAFIHNTLYSIALFLAVYLARNEPLLSTIHFAKLALLGLMVLSLVAALLKPELAIQPNYKGWIPGLSIRLWGLGSNPNSIGPLALLLLLLETLQPFERRWLRWMTVGLTLVVFVLAQSKTVWLAALISGLIIFGYRKGKTEAGRLDIRVVLGVIVLILLSVGSLSFMDIGRIWDKIAFTQAGSDISTLTGRTQIWAAAMEAWRASPVFGYGPTAWGPEHRMQIGLPFAFSAHNQFLQTASMAGSLGALALVAYLTALGAGAFRAAKLTGGVSLAIFGVFLLRSITEAPLSFGTLLNGDVLAHLLLFAIGIRGSKDPKLGMVIPTPASVFPPKRAFR
jgi:O-antigen ligase